MIYNYWCHECKGTVEVIKSVSQIDSQEYCDCGVEMRRTIAFTGGVSTDDRYKGYNPAFGKFIKNKAHLKETLAEIKGETGRELVEVGNDKTKPKRQEGKIDMQRAAEELRSKWRT